MSEQDPWRGRHRHDPRRPPYEPYEPDEPDDPSSSVFARPARPHRPEQGPYAPDRPWPAPPPPDETQQYPAARRWQDEPQYPVESAYGDGPYAGQQAYPAPRARPGQRRPAERSTPSHGPDRQSQRRPPREPRGLGLPVGAGAVVGTVGLGCFVLALLVLPWFSAGGQDITLADIRTAFTIPETQPEDILPDNGEEEPATSIGPIPSPDAVEDAARDAAAEAAAQAIDTGKARYLELYVERLWLVGAVGVALAVLFSTILAPRSFALSLLLGFRRLGGLVTVLVGLAHGAALWIVFTGDGAPTPAFAVWLGLGGLGAVLVGCILGPKPRN